MSTSYPEAAAEVSHCLPCVLLVRPIPHAKAAVMAVDLDRAVRAMIRPRLDRGFRDGSFLGESMRIDPEIVT